MQNPLQIISNYIGQSEWCTVYIFTNKVRLVARIRSWLTVWLGCRALCTDNPKANNHILKWNNTNYTRRVLTANKCLIDEARHNPLSTESRTHLNTRKRHGLFSRLLCNDWVQQRISVWIKLFALPLLSLFIRLLRKK